MTVQTHTPPAGTSTEKVTQVEAKQGTDAPKGMPVVLIVSLVAAFVLMAIAYAVIF